MAIYMDFLRHGQESLNNKSYRGTSIIYTSSPLEHSSMLPAPKAIPWQVASQQSLPPFRRVLSF